MSSIRLQSSAILTHISFYKLFSHASPHAQIPDEIERKLDSSNLTFHSKWLPQQMILNHKACNKVAGLTYETYARTVGNRVVCYSLRAKRDS